MTKFVRKKVIKQKLASQTILMDSGPAALVCINLGAAGVCFTVPA